MTMRKEAAASNLARTGLAPRGLSRDQAAAYVGVSPGLFDLMVKDGRMPRAKRLQTRLIWDRYSLDKAFDAIPNESGVGSDTDETDIWAQASV